MTSHVRARVVSYGLDHAEADVHVGNGFVWQRTSEGDIPLLPLAAVHLHGRHMLSNVVAATTISHLAGAGGASLARALDGFHGLEHVMELVATKGGVRFVNDSKATNVDAAARSIESFDRVVAIVGGKYKGGDFADLAAPLRARGASVVAIGEAAPRIHAALDGVVPVQDATTMDAAVRLAACRAVLAEASERLDVPAENLGAAQGAGGRRVEQPDDVALVAFLALTLWLKAPRTGWTALGAALLCGVWNGVLVAGLKLQPIIATLILMVAGRGVAQLITAGQIVTFDSPALAWLGSGSFLLASVLEEFFGRHASINSFTETVLDIMGRGEVMRWPTRFGKRPVL